MATYKMDDTSLFLVYEDTRINRRKKKVSHQLQHKLYFLLELLIQNVSCVATHDLAFSLY
jgi:hypothetical protein